MTSRKARPPISAERFLRMSGTEGYELVDGRPKEKAMGAEASWIQTALANRVAEFIKPAALGFVFGADCMYQCFHHKPDQIRKPDVSFVRRGRFAGDVLPKGAIEVPPDLMAEVISPKERVYELNSKIEDFRAAQVPVIWVIYPDIRKVVVFAHGSQPVELTDADELAGEPVLPGFRVRVADLFPPRPPVRP